MRVSGRRREQVLEKRKANEREKKRKIQALTVKREADANTQTHNTCIRIHET